MKTLLTLLLAVSVSWNLVNIMIDSFVACHLLMMEVMVWHFVSNSHKVMTALIVIFHSIVLVGNSLQIHRNEYSVANFFLSVLWKLLQALKILEDDMQCDIIKIGNIIRNKVGWSCTLQVVIHITSLASFRIMSLVLCSSLQHSLNEDIIAFFTCYVSWVLANIMTQY
jgi:hypothetical protein